MPNWCVCELTVKGPKAEMDKFIKAAKSPKTADDSATDLSLQKLVPMPADQQANWYDWRVTNWGTKWDIDADVNRIKPSRAHFNFNSAWAPPTGAFDKISKDYPKLTFTLIYDEPGMCFDGEKVWAKGEVVSDEYNQDEDYTGRILGLPEEDEEEEKTDCFGEPFPPKK